MCGSRPCREEAKAAIARDWMAGRKDGKDAIVLAHTRADVRDLNEAIRKARAEAGELGEAAAFQTGQGKREFAAGDRIVFLKNDRELGVKNGTLGTVEAAEAGRLTVVLDGTRPAGNGSRSRPTPMPRSITATPSPSTNRKAPRWTGPSCWRAAAWTGI